MSVRDKFHPSHDPRYVWKNANVLITDYVIDPLTMIGITQAHIEHVYYSVINLNGTPTPVGGHTLVELDKTTCVWDTLQEGNFFPENGGNFGPSIATGAFAVAGKFRVEFKFDMGSGLRLFYVVRDVIVVEIYGG